MIKRFSILLLLFISVGRLTSQDEVLGVWLSETGNGKMEIYKKGEKCYGKIVWLKSPNGDGGVLKLDDKNKIENLRTRKLIGLEVLTNLSFEGGDWQGGTIYVPGEGDSFKCTIWMDDNDTLKFRGYLGMLFKTEIWTRSSI
jgi:uncharacterized protein (DUF2147 family)